VNDKLVANELVSVARDLAAMDADVAADPDRVEELAAKFLSRLGPVKSRQLRTYGIELKPSDTVESLAKAWATVLLAM
jgi:hypothetical protein